MMIKKRWSFSFVYRSTILEFCAPLQTAIPNLPKSSIMWIKDLSLCTRELDYRVFIVSWLTVSTF